MMRALTLEEAARALGRSPDWLRGNWRQWHKDYKLPRPIHEHGTLVWDAAGLYAWLDRELPAKQRPIAAAFRAAFLAAAGADARADAELVGWQRRLAAREPQVMDDEAIEAAHTRTRGGRP